MFEYQFIFRRHFIMCTLCYTYKCTLKYGGNAQFHNHEKSCCPFVRLSARKRRCRPDDCASELRSTHRKAPGGPCSGSLHTPVLPDALLSVSPAHVYRREEKASQSPLLQERACRPGREHLSSAPHSAADVGNGFCPILEGKLLCRQSSENGFMGNQRRQTYVTLISLVSFKDSRGVIKRTSF